MHSKQAEIKRLNTVHISKSAFHSSTKPYHQVNKIEISAYSRFL